MRRWIGSLIAALLVAVPPLLADDKGADEKGNSRSTQFKNIQGDYRKAVPDAQKALRAAKTIKERDAVLDKLNEEFSPRIIKFVEADPKDNLSFQALIFAVHALPKIDGKVFDLLAKDWAKDESASNQQLCQFLMFNPKVQAKSLLQKMLDENKNKDLRGFACFALAKLAEDQNSKGDKKAADESEKYYERIEKDFAEVKLGRTTLGDQAKGVLFEKRYLTVGKTPPNVESQDLEGKKVELKDYKGKVVVLDIWATWCGPCKSMIPHEREMVKKHKDDPFALISVSGDEQKDTLKNFLKETEMPWVHWWDGMNGNIIKGWNVQAFPTIYILDTKGVIRYKFVGVKTHELDEAVEKLLDEAKEKK